MVAKAPSPRLVEVDGKVLHPYNVSCVRCREPDTGHDGDNHVLLHVELARVEVPCVAESGELLVGEDGLKKLSGRESSDDKFVRRVKNARADSNLQ